MTPFKRFLNNTQYYAFLDKPRVSELTIFFSGTMSGIVQVCCYELMFVVIKVYPSLVSRFGIEDVWSVFAVFCLASALYGAFIMPETRGKSLNEILSEFETPQKSIKSSLP